MTRSKIFTFVAFSIVALMGCSSSQDSSQTQAFNDDDVMFAQMMIPHHEQAIEMSDIALDPTIGAGEQVRQLASQIKNAQDPEIATMKNLLTLWGKPTTMDSSMDHSEMMEGMLTLDELSALGELRGAEFDSAWIAAMIRHHEGALSMARDLQGNGVSAELLKLAEEIVTSQQAEIDEMNTLR